LSSTRTTYNNRHVASLVGTTIGAYTVSEQLHAGAWDIYRGHGSGARVIVTVAKGGAVPELPAIDGIARILAAEEHDNTLVMIEREPSGWRIGDLKWPLPIDEVITVGLDLARLLARMHAAGVTHGALRPQLTWIDRTNERSIMSGTTPRPELVGIHLEGMSPFAAEPFVAGGDVGQLALMLLRMTTGRANQREWPSGDSRMHAVEDLAKSAATLDAMLAGLERLAA